MERVDPPAGLHTAPSEAEPVPLLRGALGHGASLRTRRSIAAFGTVQGRHSGPLHTRLLRQIQLLVTGRFGNMMDYAIIRHIPYLNPLKHSGNYLYHQYLKTEFCLRDRLCGPVVRVSGYRSRGPGLDSRRFQIF
jgi:hypothetical protein